MIYINCHFYKAVSAAPQPSVPLPTVRDVIREVTGVFSCALDVVEKTVEGSDFNLEFVEFKRGFNGIFIDLSNCAAFESLNQRYKFVWK